MHPKTKRRSEHLFKSIKEHKTIIHTQYQKVLINMLSLAQTLDFKFFEAILDQEVCYVKNIFPFRDKALHVFFLQASWDFFNWNMSCKQISVFFLPLFFVTKHNYFIAM